MVDTDERTINRAIARVDDAYQKEREEARAALHRLFRDRRRLEKAVDDLEEEVVEAQNEVARLREQVEQACAYANANKGVIEERDRLREAIGRARDALTPLSRDIPAVEYAYDRLSDAPKESNG